MTVEILSGKVFLVVTGASRGIGQQIAVTFGRILEKDSRVLLLARNLQELEKTAAKLPKYLKVTWESVDLSVADTDRLDGILRKHLGAEAPESFNRAVMVHNVGTLGNIKKKTTELTDFNELEVYYHLNVFSPIVLNGLFVKIFNDETKVERLVINLTSLCGSEPFIRCASYYCPGKAAREMFFRVFALQFPRVNVLNYSPGLVDTDALKDLLANSEDPEDVAKINLARAEKRLLTPEQSVERLLIVLKEQKYNTGDYVDYDDSCSCCVKMSPSATLSKLL